jgi:hypothetical protein
MSITERLKRVHAWLASHSAYFYALLAVFPEVWLQSPDLQAMLPATLVSRIAPFVAVIGFALRVRKGLPKPPHDDTDEAGA